MGDILIFVVGFRFVKLNPSWVGLLKSWITSLRVFSESLSMFIKFFLALLHRPTWLWVVLSMRIKLAEHCFPFPRIFLH